MNEFLIQKETLTNIADKFRDYLYEVGDNTHMIDPQFKSTERYLAQGAVNFTFYEEFDAAGYPANQGTYPDGSKDGGFDYCDMRRNDEGHLVPVIISGGMVDNYEGDVSGYYYVGVDVVEGVAYDKWRRIEGIDINTGNDPDPMENYTWESPFRSYLYTNRIVVPVGENITQYNPTEFDTKIDHVYKAGAASITDNRVVGTWVLNRVPSFEGVVYGVSYPVKFTTLGENTDTTFEEILFENNKYGASGDFISYIYTYEEGSDGSYITRGSYTAYSSVPVVWLTGGWDNEGFRTITIQEDIEDGWFKTWLKANAVRQGTPSDNPSLPTLTNPGTAAELLLGKQLIDGSGNIVEGEIVTKTSEDLSASGTTVTVPAGYYAEQVTKTVSDSNLISSNIKKDVNIFGVTGSLESIDLTGTTWMFNTAPLNRPIKHIPTVFPENTDGQFISNINFTSGNQNFTSFLFTTLAYPTMYVVGQINYLNGGAIKPVFNTTNGWLADEEYKLFTITGGTDATSPKLYKFLSEYCTQVPSYVDKNQITDLVGTKWILNKRIYSGGYDFNISFVSNGNTYTKFSVSEYGGGDEDYQTSIWYWPSSSTYVEVYDTYDDNFWTNQNYRTIYITGGSDTQLRAVINWLNSSATLVAI